MDEYEKSTVRLANQEEVSPLQGNQNRRGSSAGIGARTVAFKLRVARSGGEDRRLAVWQPRLQVPAGTRGRDPGAPWPAEGASRVRRNTPRNTVRLLRTEACGRRTTR